MQLEFSIPKRTIYSVGDITNRLKNLIEQHPQFKEVWVQGQISNCTRTSSGHTYFTLKDAKSQIRCALFRGEAEQIKFSPSDGEEVLVQGKIGIYILRGEYQIVVHKIEPVGIGALQKAFEALKQRLADEGLFAAHHKKPLPKFPKRIGVITSATGAAFQDICEQLRKRYPLAKVLFHPSLVQGDGAPDMIVTALQTMNTRDDIDVLIVGRGGGSIEDLQAFNEERVARAIAASTIPVVSAVGHETDYTIADMAADHRAPTPSAAIEHIVPDQETIFGQLESYHARLQTTIQSQLNEHGARIQEFGTRLSPIQRKEAIYQRYQTLDNCEAACHNAVKRRLTDGENRLRALAQRLDALSPLATLKRGYSISRKSDGAVLTAANQVSVGDKIEVQLSDGHLACRIEELLSDSQPTKGDKI